MSLAKRRALFQTLISDYSESQYCAGWHAGIEQDIRAQGGLWTVLAAACDGWPSDWTEQAEWADLTDDEWVEALDLVTPLSEETAMAIANEELSAMREGRRTTGPAEGGSPTSSAR